MLTAQYLSLGSGLPTNDSFIPLNSSHAPSPVPTTRLSQFSLPTRDELKHVRQILDPACQGPLAKHEAFSRDAINDLGLKLSQHMCGAITMVALPYFAASCLATYGSLFEGQILFAGAWAAATTVFAGLSWYSWRIANWIYDQRGKS